MKNSIIFVVGFMIIALFLASGFMALDKPEIKYVTKEFPRPVDDYSVRGFDFIPTKVIKEVEK